MLEMIDTRVREDALYAAGYLAYESAGAFDEALTSHVDEDSPTPLLWFGLYEIYEDSVPEVSENSSSSDTPLEWSAGISRADFDASIHRIREHIAAGDTYQVNYTFPLYTEFNGDSYAWFRRICAAQRGDYCAYIHTGNQVVMSFSPELFFTLNGTELRTQPMKGTLARGLTVTTDADQRAQLQESTKDRAENLMIVDLLRNDMGRIATTGSVEVESLFDLTPFDRLWQMTSTVRAETHVQLPEIFRALFPCGSVTGAPKIITSRIIRDLEATPRGAYCGTIGYWGGPEQQAEFNVAIRTATLDCSTGHLVYPVGAGITWDSSPDAEYDECLLKAQIVTQPKPSFELLESLLWDGDYFLLDRHLQRLASSAEYFGFPYDEATIRRQLNDAQPVDTQNAHKVRVLLHRDGTLQIEFSLIETSEVLRLILAREPVDENDVFLYHKTTFREVYTKAVERADTDDVLLWNTRGEVTESTRANVVVKLEGIWYTPPVSVGLLSGTYREELLALGEIQERIITKDDLTHADSIMLINSVRKWMEVDWINP